jgi:uncharacterized protein (TIGR02145 family)
VLDEKKCVILSEVKGSKSLRGRAAIVAMSCLILLSACTDYVSQIDERYGEWNASNDLLSSSSIKVVDPADVIVGFMTDSRDGQTYKTVKIGSQTWMAQNLNYKTANSYCYYNFGKDSLSYCTKYGRLYTWVAAVDKTDDACGVGYCCSLPSGDIQGVCPAGWHLPSKDEWNTLFSEVGGSSTAGIKLKSTSGWFDYNYYSSNGSDDFSFSALPAGYKGGGDYVADGEGYYAYFWSSTEGEWGCEGAYNMELSHGMIAHLDNYAKGFAYSVRCLKD